MANVYMGTDVEDFIFGEGTVYESEVTEPKVEEGTVEEGVQTPEVEEPVEEEVEVTDEEINVRGVIECVDEPEVACYRIALENEQNYNRIMSAFMSKEFSVLESTGAEMVYEAADVSTFFESVKKTIAAWWSKIQGVIKRVIDEVARRTDMNLAFVKKYKDADIKTPEKKAEFKGYDFDKAKVPNYAHMAGLVGIAVDKHAIKMYRNEEAVEEYLGKFKEKFEEMKDKMRGIACGGNGSVSADDFDKELKKALFGSEEKVDLSLKPFGTLLSELENAKVVKAAAKNAYKSAQDSVKTLMKEVKMYESELKKADRKNAGMKVAKCMTDSINACLGLMSKTMSMDTKAMITKVNQDRAMAAFYVMNQPKKEKAEKVEKTSESAVENNGLDIVII